MQQRLYIDTSVFGGYYDEEFSEFTKPLFESLQKGEYKLRAPDSPLCKTGVL